MRAVYVLEESIDYEGANTKGVFFTLDAAKNAVNAAEFLPWGPENIDDADGKSYWIAVSRETKSVQSIITRWPILETGT